MSKIKLGLTYDDVLLVPKYSAVNSRKDVVLKTLLTPKIFLNIPIISANMDTVTEHKMAVAMAKLGGIGIIHRFLSIKQQSLEIAKVKGKNSGKLLVGAALGVKNDCLKRAESLLSAGADVLVVDIAHGHSKHCLQTVKTLKKKFPKAEIIVGNVATKEGVLDLIKAGASAVKVGVGPGSMCTTRVVAGAGVPQFTAVMECSETAKKYKIPVIADGGIKNSGDIVKALAVGASTVMLGGLLAGTTESPGLTVMKNGQKYKISRGMASLTANIDRKRGRTKQIDDYGFSEYVAEGVEAMIPFRGNVADVVKQLLGGIRSGLSYAGSHNIPELQKKAEFCRVTSVGFVENHPHDVKVI